MNKQKYLGKFVRKFETRLPDNERWQNHRVVFFVRGLTVAEFIDLCEQGFIEKSKPSYSQFISIGVSTVMDIKGLSDPDSTMEEIVRQLPDETIIEVGKFVYEELTMLSEDEYNKLQGHINFLHWASKDENEKKAENFNCHTCLKKKIAKRRPCGKFTDEEIEHLHKKLQEEDEEQQSHSSDRASDLMSKYKSKKKFKTKKEAKDYKERNAITGGDMMRVGDYNFPECPVSWIPDYLQELGDVLFHCHSHDLSFFGDAVAEEPYKFYKAQKVVSGESSRLRSKEMDEETNNTKSQRNT